MIMCKHRLVRVPNEDHRGAIYPPGSDIERFMNGTFMYYECTVCRHHFYIRKEDAYNHITGKSDRPMAERGAMYIRVGGEWQLVYTIIS